MSFPENFVWGSAAASYQIEGAAYEDGKGLSVWDKWCHQPGKIWSDNTGDVACDHYHTYEEDARIMGEKGLKAYRFSISWPRVMPEGIGKVNEKGHGYKQRFGIVHVDFPTGKHTLKDSAYWYKEVISSNGNNMMRIQGNKSDKV